MMANFAETYLNKETIVWNTHSSKVRNVSKNIFIYCCLFNYSFYC